MKTRPYLFLLPAVALGLGACKKNEETKTGEDAPSVVEKAAEVVTEAVDKVIQKPSASVDERAAKLGFAQHAPADTQVLMSFYNGSETAERVKNSKLWKLIASEVGGGLLPGAGMDMEMEEDDFELEEVEQDDDAVADAEPAEPMGPAAMFSKEVSVAFGSATAAQTENLLQLNKRMTYFQMKTIAEGFARAAKAGDFSEMQDALMEGNEESLKQVLNDPASGIELFKKMNMPAMTIAFKAEGEALEDANRQLISFTSNMAMLGEMAEPIDIEKAGSQFGGFKIVGQKVSESMAESREDMEEDLDKETVDQLISAVAEKNLVVLSGKVENYAVLFLGASEDDLKFAETPADSLLASDAIAYADEYLSKDLIALVHGDKAAVDALMTAGGGMGTIAKGFRDGLTGVDGLKDARDLEALFRMVAEREEALLSMVSTDATGTVAFYEEGVKIESFGGADNGLIDWDKPNTLGSLGESPDVAVFANLTSTAEYDKKAGEFLESLVETAYAIAMKVSEIEGGDGDIEQFKEMVKMFDGTFRPDVATLLDALRSDVGGGLGRESALVLDLKGGVPPIPGVPQAVVDEGRFPRITTVRPVTDRAKLGEGWSKMNSSLTSILGKVSEMSGNEIPMQKPISSEKNGFTTWFFSMPFFSDDFMPSVTVGDEWFAVSTSKNQSLDLLAQAAAGKPGEAGMKFVINFKAFQDFANLTIDTLEKNADDIGMSASDLKDARKVVAAMDDFDKFSVRTYKDGGSLRTSMHFKTR